MTNPTYYQGDLRDDLLERAIEIIAESGTHAMSIRALTKSLGVSHNALSNHFASKRALFGEIARLGFIGLERTLSKPVPDSTDPIHRLRALGMRYLEFAASHPAHYRVMFRNDLFAPDDIEQEARAAYSVLVEACQRAQRAGWRRDVPTPAVATMLWAVAHGHAQLEAEGAILAASRAGVIDAVLDMDST